MTWFRDVLNAPELNWGCNPITIKTEYRRNEYGMIKVERVEEEVFDDISSPQLFDIEEVQKLGFGDYVNREVYECFSIRDIPINTDPLIYRTILFNGREYDIIRSSFFGVDKGMPTEQGYHDVLFSRIIQHLGS